MSKQKKLDRPRVRIAPSPTGPLHIGTARSALFNFLFARKYDGKFILRIEDTDLERSDSKYEKDILEGLAWLGICWDEGPKKEQGSKVKGQRYLGKFAPYRQSERIKTYTKYIKKLLNEGKAYHCFCTLEELEKERRMLMKKGLAPRYSGKCRSLTKEEIEKYKKEGRKSIIRFRTPENERIVFDDLIRGKIEFETNLIGDISIAKDEQTPLYNFAVVVDDYTMKITHVIRGEDHISNTPKQILIQNALGFPQPKYAHLPLILGPDKTKLSKRHGATSISEYKNQGYLPQALINFMALLGWNPGTENEIFSLQDLIKEFDLKRVQKSGAIFNIDRLDWMNGYYIRKTGLEELTNLCISYLEKAGLIQKQGKKWKIEDGSLVDTNYIRKVVSLEQERMKKLSQIGDNAAFFFKDKIEYDKNLLKWKDTPLNKIKENLVRLERFLDSCTDIDFSKKEILEKKIKEMIKREKIETGEALWPLRCALSGKKGSPSPFEIANVLGKRRTINRIKEAIRKL